MSPSPGLDERFADWVDDRLSAADRDRLEYELRGDSALRSAAEGYRATVELLRGALAGEERAPEDLVDTIVAAADGSGGGGVHRRSWGMWIALAAAAGLLVYVAMPWGSGGDAVRDVAVANKPDEYRDGKKALDFADRDRMDRSKAEQAKPSEEFARAGEDNRKRGQAGVQGKRAQQQQAEEAKDDTLEQAVKVLTATPSEPNRVVLDALEVELRNQRASAMPDPAELPVVTGPETELEGAEVRRLEQGLERGLERPSKKTPEKVATPMPMPQLVMVVPVPEGAAQPGDAPAPTAAGRRERGAGQGRGGAGATPPLPSFLTAPEVMGETRLGNRLQMTVAPAASVVSPIGFAAPGGDATNYQPFPGDQLFTIQGSEQELPLYFTRLQNHLAVQGSQLQVQWAQPGAVPPDAYRAYQQAGQVMLRQKAQTEADEKQAAALRSVLLVLRQQAAATQRDK